ncbi:M15 family metallopeptidase [uncultured Oscillibacter sp.]|uniref:M15 family metallopeptidase n=1 Tax=uncultured Oscillibacter sp. TaxID=876091 RepID=UPI002805B778|nr:M15 family metallopeptidase [uncultured Oscillibacter sp.]
MRRLRLSRDQVFTGPLLLVNRDHPLRHPSPAALAPVDSRHPDILLESRSTQMLSACIRQVGGGREIVPVSGWRSQAEQQRIWDDTLAAHGQDFTRRYVALPGCSEHQTGLAIDLGRAAAHIDFIRPAFPYDGLCGEFRRAAPRYGFIERYPRGKEAVTGISHEPWHFRYVGAPHAQLMAENGLCLEEYRAFLRRSPRSCRLENGRMAQVFYVPSAGAVTEVELPDGCCQVSGDNVDGFIVTAWGTCT